MKSPSEFSQKARQAGIATTIPFVFLAGPAAGFLIGGWLDKQFGTDPYCKASLIILGFLGSVREVFRLIKVMAEESD